MLSDRLKSWTEILHPTWQWLVVAPFAILSTLTAVRDEVLSADVAAKYTLPQVLPDWSWQVWALLTLAILVPLILESAYRAMNARDKKIEELDARLTPDFKLSFDPDKRGVTRNVERFNPGAGAKEYSVTIVRVAVNCLRDHPVMSMAHITEAWRSEDGETFVPLDLPVNVPLGNFDAVKSVDAHIELARASERDNVLRVTNWPIVLEKVIQNRGTLRVRVVAEYRGITDEIGVDIVWLGEWGTLHARQVELHS